MGPFNGVGIIFALGAAALHVVIFYLESFAWTSDGALKAFNMTKEEAESTEKIAFNQGFYNLFLAIEVFVGVFLMANRNPLGKALVTFAVCSMEFAAILLFVTSPDKRSAAIKQAIFPLMALCNFFM